MTIPARAKIKAALERYYEVNRNFNVVGETEAERRFSDGEREDTAKEAMLEELCALTPDDLRSLLLPEPAAGGGDRRVTIGPDAENGNNRRLFVDGSQWAKIYGWDDESVEARANEIVAALSAAPSPRQLDEGVIERLVDLLRRAAPRCKEDAPYRCANLGGDTPGDPRLCCQVRAALAAIASPLDGGGK